MSRFPILSGQTACMLALAATPSPGGFFCLLTDRLRPYLLGGGRRLGDGRSTRSKTGEQKMTDRKTAGSHGHNHGHGHDHNHGHDHGHSRFGLPDDFVEMRGQSKRRLTIALVLIGGYMFVDVAGGIVSGSLGLIAHAGHLLSDTGAMVLALIAMHFAGRSATATRTYGYHRLETLAALVSVISLSLIAGGILVESVQRLGDVSEVDGAVMLSVGSAGLVVNILAAWILHGSAAHNLNVEGVFRHILADLLGSVGIVISGILVMFHSGGTSPTPSSACASGCSSSRAPGGCS